MYRNCENNGIEIINNATTPKHRKRFIIYDKERELQKANNRDFMAWVNDKDIIEKHFKGKVRFELNLRTKEQVRRFLDVQDNRLMSVLQSTANPILSVYDLAINEDRASSTVIYGKPDKLALLQQCGYDLQEVEMRIRATMSKTSSIGRRMEPYRKLLQDIQASDRPPMNIRDLIAG